MAIISNIPGIIYGDTRRIRHESAGGLVAYWQVVHYGPPEYWILLYTTAPEGTRWGGNMSVLKRVPEGVRVIAEKSIGALPDGTPTEIRSVQRYWPPPLYCPNELSVGAIWNSVNTGTWSYGIGDVDPPEPVSSGGLPVSRFAHNIKIYSDDGESLHVLEEYDDAANGVFEYRRHFVFSIKHKELEYWTDAIAGMTVRTVHDA